MINEKNINLRIKRSLFILKMNDFKIVLNKSKTWMFTAVKKINKKETLFFLFRKKGIDIKIIKDENLFNIDIFNILNFNLLPTNKSSKYINVYRFNYNIAKNKKIYLLGIIENSSFLTLTDKNSNNLYNFFESLHNVFKNKNTVKNSVFYSMTNNKIDKAPFFHGNPTYDKLENFYISINLFFLKESDKLLFPLCSTWSCTFLFKLSSFSVFFLIRKSGIMDLKIFNKNNGNYTITNNKVSFLSGKTYWNLNENLMETIIEKISNKKLTEYEIYNIFNKAQ